MKNPNSPFLRLKRGLIERWSGEDFPGAKPRFQLQYFAKDIATYLLLPLGAILLYNFFSSPRNTSNKPTRANERSNSTGFNTSLKSQIIEFQSAPALRGSRPQFAERSPGSLVKLRLQNVVETYSTAPVHAQIVDRGLGERLLGGKLIGDAVPDATFERINISFRFVRDPNRDGTALSIAARALSLDGSLGLEAKKKEGFVTRSAIGSAHNLSQDVEGGKTGPDLKDVLIRALTSGLIQELGSGSQVEHNRGQVLTLPTSIEFFAELTDFFPKDKTRDVK